MLAPGSHCEPQANNIVELLLFTASKMVPHSKVIIFQSRLPSQLLRARSRLGYTRGKNLIRRHCSKAGQTTNQSHSQHDINIINLKNSQVLRFLDSVCALVLIKDIFPV